MPLALSKSMKSFKIRSFFYEKWLLFHNLTGAIDIKSDTSVHLSLDAFILYIILNQKTRYVQMNILYDYE